MSWARQVSHVFLITGEELNLSLNDISESRFIPTYGASRLPSELTLVDGVVTGVFTQPGRYLCTFTASNPDGEAKPVDITILVYPARRRRAWANGTHLRPSWIVCEFPGTASRHTWHRASCLDPRRSPAPAPSPAACFPREATVFEWPVQARPDESAGPHRPPATALHPWTWQALHGDQSGGGL